MNRKYWLFALAAALLLTLFCGSAALAADDPLKVSMALETNKFSEPTEITVSISVTNVGESHMPGPVTLYYPSGKQVEEFGSPTLSVGTTKPWSGKWKVTQAELDAGRITFKIRYSLYNDDGELVYKAKNFSKTIIYAGATPELNISRDIKPTTAQKDLEVSVTYEIENNNICICDWSSWIGDDIKLKPLEADAMFAGVMIDSNGFVTKTGIRTFEAAAYLRRCGADVTRIRKAFRTDMPEYIAKARSIASAQMFMGCYALAVCDAEGAASPTVLSVFR